MTEPILRLENVSYAYPDGPTAVESLSVCVEKGERVAVLGRNGAGKSTLLMLLWEALGFWSQKPAAFSAPGRL